MDGAASEVTDRPCPVIDSPVSDVDLFSDETLLNPYPVYDHIRDLGPAVWMTKLGCFAFTRFEDVRGALGNATVFCSGQGVTMNDRMNETLQGIVLCTDGAEHDVMRKVLIAPLVPKALRELTERITNEAEGLIERLMVRKRFDAATDLAHHLPVTIVSDLVGLPEEGRERMLLWSAANLDCFGPMNQRTLDAFPIVEEMVRYAFEECVPGKLKPGGWAARIWEAADRGEIRHEQCPVMMNDYMGPSLDTTICATQAAIRLFAENPDQWDLLVSNPTLIPNAVNEVVRIESPVQNFSRVTTADYDVGNVTIPSGSRVVLSYGAANRDPRRWENPDRFDIQRRVSDHVGFGYGAHQCIGNNLARMEIAALLNALIKRVSRIELHGAERRLNNVLRGHESLEVSFH